MIGKKLIYIAQVNDKRYLHHWTVMSCTSSTSNVLLCGGLSRSDCEIYDPRSIARQISDVFNAMIRCNKKYQAVVTAASNSNYAVFILDGQEFCPQALWKTQHTHDIEYFEYLNGWRTINQRCTSLKKDEDFQMISYKAQPHSVLKWIEFPSKLPR